MAIPTQDLQSYLKVVTTPPPPGSPYALPVPGSERPNRSPVYRNWRFQNGPLLETLDANHRTFHDLFEYSASKKPNARCLGWRPWNPTTQSFEPRYEWISYAEVAERRKNFGAGLVEIHERGGLHGGEKYPVGLWSQNRPEWQITDLALMSQALYGVSLYETMGPEAIEYIINHAQLSCVVSSLSHVATLLKLAPRIPTVKLVVCMESLDGGEPAANTKRGLLQSMATHVGIRIFSMEEVEKLGAASGRGMRPPNKDDIITVNYTSGTTGPPKGVLIRHKMAVAGITNGRTSELPRAHDVHISYLPLAHIYGRVVEQIALAEGAAVGYFHGDIAALVEDLKLLRPTVLFSVPRLYNRIASAVQAATVDADGIRGALSRQVIETKKASMKLGPGKATNKHLLYDRIWTPKVLKAVGLHRCRTMVSGSAQLDPAVHEFLSAAFGNRFSEGYGMTETYAGGLLQSPGDYSHGNIGPPGPSIEVCLESVPEYEYSVHDKPNPRGELLLRGPMVFGEYYRNPEATKKDIEEDGWFHSGDIVEVDKLGRLKIIDRKKNVLKLSQGEYISPERIENVYTGSTNLIATAFVHGDPQESCLVAIMAIEPTTFAPFASGILKKTISAADSAALKVAANHARVKKAFLKQLDAIGKTHKLNSYEKVKNCYFDIDPFTVDNELLTPTLKLKRPQAAKAFRTEIDRMYEELKGDMAGKAKL